MDHNTSGSSAHGILQASILERVAISFSACMEKIKLDLRERKRNHWVLGRGSSMGRFPFPGAHCDLSMEIHIWSDEIWDRDQTGSKDKDFN